MNLPIYNDVLKYNQTFISINRKIYLGNSISQLHLAFEQCTYQSCSKYVSGFSEKNVCPFLLHHVVSNLG